MGRIFYSPHFLKLRIYTHSGIHTDPFSETFFFPVTTGSQNPANPKWRDVPGNCGSGVSNTLRKAPVLLHKLTGQGQREWLLMGICFLS